MKLLDGAKLRDKILEELKLKIEKENIRATLAIILVGDNEASKIYIKNKEKYCNQVGINIKKFVMDANVSEEELICLIEKLNKDDEITAIILQSPIPNHLNYDYCSSFINSNKDVDGFTKDNIYDLYLGNDTIYPCTVIGIIKLLEEEKIPIAGSHVVIVGRGKIVGLPLSLALIHKDATVSIVHSKTKNIKELTKMADILIVATGKKHLIKSNMIKDNAVVVDVGITREGGKIYGDVDFLDVQEKCSYISKVPGGVGPMTVAMIMANVIKLKERKGKNE